MQALIDSTLLLTLSGRRASRLALINSPSRYGIVISSVTASEFSTLRAIKKSSAAVSVPLPLSVHSNYTKITFNISALSPHSLILHIFLQLPNPRTSIKQHTTNAAIICNVDNRLSGSQTAEIRGGVRRRAASDKCYQRHPRVRRGSAYVQARQSADASRKEAAE